MRYSIIVMLMLAGCATPQEMAYRQQVQTQQEQEQKAAYREALAQSCDAIGFKRGTDTHAQCILSQHQKRQDHLMQAIGMQQQREYRALPPCSSLPPGLAGYARADGSCR